MAKSDLTNLSKIVLQCLIAKKEPIKAQELVNDLDMNLRSVHYALKLLTKQNLVERIPNLEDLRFHIYHLRSDNIHLVKKLLN